MVPVLFTLDLPKIIMPPPCFLRKLGGGQSLLCSVSLDILSDSFIESLIVKIHMFHLITTLKKYKQEHLKCMCANGR